MSTKPMCVYTGMVINNSYEIGLRHYYRLRLASLGTQTDLFRHKIMWWKTMISLQTRSAQKRTKSISIQTPLFVCWDRKWGPRERGQSKQFGHGFFQLFLRYANAGSLATVHCSMYGIAKLLHWTLNNVSGPPFPSPVPYGFLTALY